MTDDMEVNSKYLKKRMRMIWTLPLPFFVKELIDKEEDRNDHIGTCRGIRAARYTNDITKP